MKSSCEYTFGTYNPWMGKIDYDNKTQQIFYILNGDIFIHNIRFPEEDIIFLSGRSSDRIFIFGSTIIMLDSEKRSWLIRHYNKAICKLQNRNLLISENVLDVCRNTSHDNGMKEILFLKEDGEIILWSEGYAGEYYFSLVEYDKIPATMEVKRFVSYDGLIYVLCTDDMLSETKDNNDYNERKFTPKRDIISTVRQSHFIITFDQDGNFCCSSRPNLHKLSDVKSYYIVDNGNYIHIITNKGKFYIIHFSYMMMEAPKKIDIPENTDYAIVSNGKSFIIDQDGLVYLLDDESFSVINTGIVYSHSNNVKNARKISNPTESSA